jgi:hypothetical protein
MIKKQDLQNRNGAPERTEKQNEENGNLGQIMWGGTYGCVYGATHVDDI